MRMEGERSDKGSIDYLIRRWKTPIFVCGDRLKRVVRRYTSPCEVWTPTGWIVYCFFNKTVSGQSEDTLRLAKCGPYRVLLMFV